jgi:hypothetical protein
MGYDREPHRVLALPHRGPPRRKTCLTGGKSRAQSGYGHGSRLTRKFDDVSSWNCLSKQGCRGEDYDRNSSGMLSQSVQAPGGTMPQVFFSSHNRGVPNSLICHGLLDPKPLVRQQHAIPCAIRSPRIRLIGRAPLLQTEER